MLILAGAEVNKPNSLNHTPLAAIIFRLVEEPPSFENNLLCFRLAEFLIDHGADINWVIDKSRGFSLLHYFCSIKIKMSKEQIDLNFRIIKFLLEKGANVFQKTLKDEGLEKILEKHCNKCCNILYIRRYFWERKSYIVKLCLNVISHLHKSNKSLFIMKIWGVGISLYDFSM